MSKKKIFVSALAICLVAVISMGTLAYFSDNDEVTNKFMIAGSDTNKPEDVFSVDVFETVDNVKYDADDIYARVDNGKTYENILPGGTYEKDVTVKNTGSYAEYVRVQVTISDKTAWQASLDLDIAGFGAYDITPHFVGFNSALWQFDKTRTTYDNDSITYTLYLKDAVAPGAEVNIFDAITLPTTMSREDAVLFDDDGTAGFTVKVRADAVQAENVGDTCYDAFVTVYGVNA